jgi:glyoxylase-like metal-dependent hydrolase (beta-lactamase superfamily II)
MILEAFSLGPAETNAYLLGCQQTKRAAVIDAPFGSADIVHKRAEHLGLHIEILLLTHSHWDHIAEAAAFKEKWQIPLYIHEEDAENLKHPGSDRLPLFFPVKGVEPDGFLSDHQTLKVGELSIEVIHTPGHTPGGVCFYLPAEHALISGDTLFQGTIGNLSFPTARPHLMWDSLKKLAQLPPSTDVYPGHGDPTTIRAESWITHAKDRYN